MEKKLIKETKDAFYVHFGAVPDHIFLSPGRINIIGEHVDYNDGFVLPAAINRYICFAATKNNESSVCRIVALDFNDSFSFDMHIPLEGQWPGWAGYLLGVIEEIRNTGKKLGGLNIVFKGNIPMGAGLSSSAALECGFATILNNLFNLQFSKKEIALIGQKSENNFVGVKCGIMDQFASVFGMKDKVILLNCDSLEYEYYDAKMADHSFILFDSCIKHTHLTSGYNDRRNEVEAGKKMVYEKFPYITSFRDCTTEMIEEVKNDLGEISYKRCLYVVEEINRVIKATDALKNNQPEILGNLLTETHHGLSELYEVSCPELDFLVHEAVKMEGVLGARMMGGGFGGCSINLIRTEKAISIIEEMKFRYHKVFGISLRAYKVNISDGAKEYIP